LSGDQAKTYCQQCVWNLEESGPENLIDKAPVDIVRLLLKGIGWLSWGQLKAILEITRGEFRAEVERKFVEDLIIYLYNYRITDAWHRVFFLLVSDVYTYYSAVQGIHEGRRLPVEICTIK
jgi:hypothetical protein